MSKPLHRLIDTLSPEERNEVRLHLGIESGAGSNFLTLFSALCKGEDVPGSIDTETSYRSSLETKLYHKILNYLIIASKDKDPNWNNVRKLAWAKLHFNRGLYEGGKKILKQSPGRRERAHGLLFDLLRIHEMQRAAFYFNDIEEMSRNNTFNLKVESKLLEKYLNLKKYERLWQDIFLIIANYHLYSKRPETKQVLQSIRKDPSLKSERSALTPEAKIFFHRINGYFAFTSRNMRLALRHGEKAYIIFLLNGWLIEEQPLDYLKSVRNLILSLHELGRFKKAIGLSKESLSLFMKKNVHLSPEVTREAFFLEFGMLLDFYTQARDQEKAFEIAQRCHDAFSQKKFTVYTPDFVTIRFNTAYSYFCRGRLLEASQHVNFLMSRRQSNVRQDIHTMNEILFIMIQIDRENYSLASRSIQKFLRSSKQRITHYPFEMEFLALAELVLRICKIKAHDPDIYMQAMDICKTFSNRKKAHLRNLEIAAWVMHKANGSPMNLALKALPKVVSRP